MATFQRFQRSGQHWYRLRADDGEIVQSSEGYTTKAACENGIQRVKASCQPQRFRSVLESGQSGFNHVAANGETIGRNEKYPAKPASSRASTPVSSASHSQRRDVSTPVVGWGEAGKRNGIRTAGKRTGAKTRTARRAAGQVRGIAGAKDGQRIRFCQAI